MYREYYGLKDLPFRLTADPAYVYMTGQHREALSGLVYSVCARPGLTVLVGEAGTGKSTLLYTLTDLLEKQHHPIAYCNNPMLTREEFYDLLILKLRVDCSYTLKSRQLTALQEKLLRDRAAGRPAVLIVDEAQRLPLELLEEIRLLLNLETPREKLLEIILAGQPELWGTLERPELRQFKQRISTVCRLNPLTSEEVAEYIQHRLLLAGLPDQKLFPPRVAAMVCRYSQGIPRLINSLCDSALQTGFALQAKEITPDILAEAAADLEMAPAAANDAEKGLPASPGTDGSKIIPMPSINVEPPLLDKNGHENGSAASARVPLESYSSRQESFSFLGRLLERWK